MARPTAAGRAAAQRVHARGAALLVVMVVVVLLSLATLVPLRNEQQAMQRERERELLFIGEQFRQALASYAAASPVGTRKTPGSWADLLEDKRFPNARRHLRRVYSDPMTGQADWSLLRQNGGIVGVASSSARAPLKRSGFAAVEPQFVDAASYADWKFVPQLVAQSALTPPTTPVTPSHPSEEPIPPESSPSPEPAPPSNPVNDKRRECFRVYTVALEACVRDQSTSVTCRNQAQVEFRACLGG